MAVSELETISQRLTEGLCCDDDAQATLCTQLLRLLAEGQPVSPAQLAATLQLSRAVVDQTLKQVPNVEFDDQGRIIAAGLSQVPTPHQFRANGHTLYTWCAIDTLMYPLVLQRTAQVASRCPVTGRMVRLTVTPDEVTDLDPADTLVTVVIPEAAAARCDVRCDVRGVFCQHVHFLHGPAAGAIWRAAHPGTTLLSVAESLGLVRRLAACRYRLAPH
jgi:alkylmercury lyase